MEAIQRPIIFQPFSTFAVTAGTTATPIMPTSTKVDLINSFVLSVDAGAANNVFVGDQGVTVTSGLEIVAGGGPVLFSVEDERMKYEILFPLMAGLESFQCKTPQGFGIPFIMWDLSQIYLIAAAATNVRCAVFRSQFI